MTTPRDSLERIVPDALEAGSATGQETLDLHLARYRFAVEQLGGGRVLDLACGVGYGSAMLAEAPGVTSVIGGDIALGALHHARSHYAHPRVARGCGDHAGWLRPGAFDAIVSLETIEHVPDPSRLIREFATLLRPGGVLIASVPVTPSVDANPHHRTDFTERSFLALGASAGFAFETSLRQVQPYSPIRILARREARTQDLRPALWRYYLAHPDAAWRRVLSTLRHGFTNHYLTAVWRRR